MQKPVIIRLPAFLCDRIPVIVLMKQVQLKGSNKKIVISTEAKSRF